MGTGREARVAPPARYPVQERIPVWAFFAILGVTSVAGFWVFLLGGSLLSLQVAFAVLALPWEARRQSLPPLEGSVARLAALVGASGTLLVGSLLLLAPAQLSPILFLSVAGLTVLSGVALFRLVREREPSR